MALTNTTILAGTTTFIVDTEATAAGDITTGNIAHGLGAVPLDVSVTPLLLDFYTKQPFVVTLDITNVVLTLVNAGGVANDQIRTRVSLPHTLVR